MVWIILAIGFLAIALCLAILIAPKTLRKIIDFFSIGSRIYLAGAIRIALGVMLLVLATHSRLWGYVVTLGLLATTAGVSTFFLALKRTKKLLARLRNQSNLTLRLFAIAGLALWALLVYALLLELPPFLPR